MDTANSSSPLLQKLPPELIGLILRELLWLTNPWPEPMWRIKVNCLFGSYSTDPIHLPIQQTIFSLRRVSRLMKEHVKNCLPGLVENLKSRAIEEGKNRARIRRIYSNEREIIKDFSKQEVVPGDEAAKLRDAQICDLMLSRGWLTFDEALENLETEEYKERLKKMAEIGLTIFPNAAKIETMEALQMERETYVLSRLLKFSGDDDVYAKFEDIANGEDGLWNWDLFGDRMFEELLGDELMSDEGARLGPLGI